MAQFLTDTQINSVYELYIGYFNRAPEAGGLNYWSNYYLGQVNAGKTDAAIQKDIANQFYSAAVQYNIYSAGTPVADFVKASYLNALGRDSVDDAGMTYWTAKLTSGEVSRGEFVQKLISDAKGFASDATYGWVTKYLDNRMAVAKAFAAANTTITGDAAITAGKAALSAVTPAAVKAGQTTAQALAAAAGFTSVAGNTFTLTTGVDKATANVFNGYLNVQTGQNNETLSSGDELTGTGTNPTLNAEVSGFAHTIAPALLKGIETVNLTVSPLAPTAIGVVAGNVTLNAAAADAIKNVSVTANNLGGGAVTLTNLATKVETLALSQNANNVTLTSLAAPLAGATDSIAVSLDQVTGGVLTLNTATGTNGFETVALTSQGTIANTLGTLTATGATKVTVAGAQNLTVTNALPNSVVNVDATGFTGQLDVTAGNGVMTMVGGSGNDTFRFAAGQFNTSDKVDGGTAGTDTLRVAAAADLEAITTANANIVSIEALTLQNGGTAGATLRADLLGTSVNTINLLDGTAAGTYAVRMNAGANTISVSNTAGGVAGLFGNGGVTLEANGTATTDSLVLNLNGDDLTTTPAVETSDITVGNLNLNSNGRAIESITINTSNAATNHTIGTITLPNTVGAVDTITVAGSSSLTIGAVTADKVDATGLTNNAALTMGVVANTAPGGLLILGSAGNDRLVGSAQGDSITDGAGNDRVVLGAGVDAVTLSAGDDRVIFGETIASAALSSANFDNVTGFTVGTTALAGDRVIIDSGATQAVGLAQLALTAAGAVAIDPAASAETAVVGLSLAQGQALVAAGTDTFLKLTTAVATAAGTTAQQAFALAMGAGSIAVTDTANMLGSFYDSTNGKAVLFTVAEASSGDAANTIVAADTVLVVGMIDMTAADYANFGANNIFFA